MSFPETRPRRLRRNAGLRRLVRETRLHPAQFVDPIFIREDIKDPVNIDSLPGQRQETIDSAATLVEQSLKLGINSFLLFGVPTRKDAQGSEAWNETGIIQRALRSLRDRFGNEIILIADNCLDEYTDHGHCGILTDSGDVDNDATIELYAKSAIAQAAAGADIIAPSGMMDGQVAAIRQALDKSNFSDIAIMAYSAKYASVMYGPFRDAADCAPKSGDRRGYQMDAANIQEALKETQLDIEEGADIVMVKPALTCLDVIRVVRENVDLPVAAYNVSGEYAMVKRAAAAGAFDERLATLEVLTAIVRAGADIVITYHARQAAKWLMEEQ